MVEKQKDTSKVLVSFCGGWLFYIYYFPKKIMQQPSLMFREHKVAEIPV